MHHGHRSFAACRPAAAPETSPGGTAGLRRQDLMHQGDGHGEACGGAAALQGGPEDDANSVGKTPCTRTVPC
jgi:hypothetical protein